MKLHRLSFTRVQQFLLSACDERLTSCFLLLKFGLTGSYVWNSIDSKVCARVKAPVCSGQTLVERMQLCLIFLYVILALRWYPFRYREYVLTWLISLFYGDRPAVQRRQVRCFTTQNYPKPYSYFGNGCPCLKKKIFLFVKLKDDNWAAQTRPGLGQPFDGIFKLGPALVDPNKVCANSDWCSPSHGGGPGAWSGLRSDFLSIQSLGDQKPTGRLIGKRCGKPILKIQAPQDHQSHKNHRIKEPQKAPQTLKQFQTPLKHWPHG
jgi:hypothetical protein